MRIPCTQIPDFWFPNSEFRMAYARSGIPHHEIADCGGAVADDPETDFGMIGVMGHGMSYLGMLCK